jgi:hypothetical protein
MTIPTSTYRQYLEDTIHENLFNQLNTITPRFNALIQCEIHAEVEQKVDNLVYEYLVSVSTRRTLAYLRSNTLKDLYWALKKESKSERIKQLLPSFSEEEAEKFKFLNSTLLMRPETKKVQKLLYFNFLMDLNERQLNWMNNLENNLCARLLNSIDAMPGEKRIHSIQLKLQYARYKELNVTLIHEAQINIEYKI